MQGIGRETRCQSLYEHAVSAANMEIHLVGAVGIDIVGVHIFISGDKGRDLVDRFAVIGGVSLGTKLEEEAEGAGIVRYTV